MGQTTITITVHTVNLSSGSSTPVCCTISQIGGILIPDPNDPPNPELAVSEVYKGDNIIWSGIAHDGVTIINITASCNLPNYFGMQLHGYPPGGGSIVTRAAEHLMDNPLPYTIYFNIEGIDEQFNLDPKIWIKPPPVNPSSGV